MPRRSPRSRGERGCIIAMQGEGNMMDRVAALLKGKHACITIDGWTSCENDTYMSRTVGHPDCLCLRLDTISLDCSKSDDRRRSCSRYRSRGGEAWPDGQRHTHFHLPPVPYG